MIRLARSLAASALTASLLVMSGFAAHAQDPINIPPGKFLVDNSDVLTPAEEKTLTGAIKDLTQETGQSLYVIYVDTFSNPANAQQWLGATADLKGLGSTDSMLVIATDQRAAQLESHSGGDVAAYDSQVFAKYTKPKLSTTDWLGAGIATVTGVKDAVNGKLAAAAKPTAKSVPKGVTTQTSVSKSSSFEGLGTIALWVIGGIALAVLAVLYFMLGWHNRLIALLNRPKLEELQSEAGSLLFNLNRSVEQMGESSMFAMAQYGKGVTKNLDTDLNSIQEELGRLFKIQRDVEDTANKKSKTRTLLNEIITSANEANTKLEKHKNALAGLAEEEANISSELQRQKDLLSKAERTVKTNDEALNKAVSQYEAEALSEIHKNSKIQLAALDSLRPTIDTLDATVSSGKSAKAVGVSYVSREALSEFDRASEALSQSWRNLHDNDNALKNLSSKVSTAIERSSVLINSGYKAQLESSREVAKQALENSSLGKLNPVSKTRTLSSTTSEFFKNLEKVESEVAAINRARKELPGVMSNATQTIMSTESYISQYRGDVGGSAVSMLTTAKGQLEMAMLNDTGRDLRAAHRHALDSLDSAQKAQSRARSDVSEAERRRRQLQQQLAASAAAASAASYNHHNNFNNNHNSFNSGGGGGGGFGSGGAGGNF